MGELRFAQEIINPCGTSFKWICEKLDEVKADFNKNSPLQGIIGAIDGTHILIKAPKAQKKFNIALSSKRLVIERAFALLKGRFRRLKFLDMNVDEMIPYVIIASTVLHNICLDGIDENNIEDFIQEGMEVENDEAYVGNIPNEEAGEMKRGYLCALVAEA
ncbi:nuclease harbi1 [Lasius niger]|uniref:Nuclease harbi1 n=1 Tax=Lasius niger TaxID=67767 RepID=A0A0J7K933_LASNI|nr:nuclease harbi1 [Lasius niger]